MLHPLKSSAGLLPRKTPSSSHSSLLGVIHVCTGDISYADGSRIGDGATSFGETRLDRLPAMRVLHHPKPLRVAPRKLDWNCGRKI